jgi:hypothetical protein
MKPTPARLFRAVVNDPSADARRRAMDIANLHAEEAMNRLALYARAASDPKVALSAIQLLLAYSLGRPTENVAVTHTQGELASLPTHEIEQRLALLRSAVAQAIDVTPSVVTPATDADDE